MMEGDSKTTRTTIDAGSWRHSNCLNCLSEFDAAVDQMRSAQGNDIEYLLDSMTAEVKEAFNDLEKSEEDVEYVAVRAVDRLYRIASQLEMFDVHAHSYVSTVVREFFNQLYLQNLNTYYVLDNALRADRFQGVCMIFELVGIKVIAPQLQGTDWKTLSGMIIAHTKSRVHVAYIEPDSLVNYIELAVLLAKDLDCVATFRNEAPKDPIFEALAMPDTAQENNGFILDSF